MKTSLKFLGAAGTVTGSKTLLQQAGRRILIDCGLFQGLKELRLLNWEDFPLDPVSIESLLLTHAHLDHCGYIPLLVKKGFRNPIHCTEPTVALSQIILTDSAKIQEEEAERANRYGYTKHHPAKPLYTRADVTHSMPFFTPHQYREWVIINEYFKFQFLNAGHILGSAMVEVKAGDKKILFSGDLGRARPMLLRPPAHPPGADVLVLESTYGDRFHPQVDAKEELHEIIWGCYEKNGTLIVPTFAVERAQELLFLLAQLRREARLPELPIFLDSPMGINATDVYLQAEGWHRLSAEQLTDMSTVAHLITDVQTSKAVVADPRPKIVLAGSGMITGGRVLHYLSRHLADPRSTVLLVGYQAAGTRGRALEEGATELKFFGEYHPVKAEVRKISSLSGHADQGEIMQWLRRFKRAPKQVLLNHGEPQAAHALRVKIEYELGWPCAVVQPGRDYTF
ncbi:MAG: MBL fold metallo-hydrolase [Bacteroidetes bacterium]|nr:MAG: MBL fold metallo-hydrolase [Bacteroidota bacterium]